MKKIIFLSRALAWLCAFILLSACAVSAPPETPLTPAPTVGGGILDVLSPAPLEPANAPAPPAAVSVELGAPVRIYRIHKGYLYAIDYIHPNPLKITSPEGLRALYEAYPPRSEWLYGEGYTEGYDSDEEIPRIPSPKSLIADILINEKYNETFFEGAFLIFIEVQEGSGSIRHRVNSVVAENGRLAINVHRLCPMAGETDVGEWIIVLEMDNEFAEFEIVITRSEELWIPGSEDWPDTPGASEGRDPYDEEYRREAFLDAVDAFWENDLELLKTYYLGPDYAQLIYEALREQISGDVFEAVARKELIPVACDHIQLEDCAGLLYVHPALGGYDLKITPGFFVVNNQLKLMLDFSLEKS